jgi:hypothetical protein
LAQVPRSRLKKAKTVRIHPAGSGVKTQRSGVDEPEKKRLLSQKFE